DLIVLHSPCLYFLLLPLFFHWYGDRRDLHSFPTRRSSELPLESFHGLPGLLADSLPDRYGAALIDAWLAAQGRTPDSFNVVERRSEEHTSELQSRENLVCRLLLEKKKKKTNKNKQPQKVEC